MNEDQEIKSISTIDMKHIPWEDRISNHQQIGGIETSVLDNGRGRGTRIAWINTGTGLRYKVVIDRSLDIADAFYNHHSLAWLSHVGVTSPNPAAIRGLEWLRTFGGGLLSTCGLTHIGVPESDEYGERGLHGRIGNIPAELESIVQPNPEVGNLGMSITGRIRESVVFGPHIELKRTISGKLGEPILRIHDEVYNMGNTAAPHMMLYHFNFGWPLVDEGTDILWNGIWESRDSDMDRKIFSDGNEFRKCAGPSDTHLGGGEACAFIDIQPDSKGKCTCGLYNSHLGLAVALRFEKKQLPWLTLEPGTNPPIGQSAARKQKKLIWIEPGEKRIYKLEFLVTNNEEEINKTFRSI